MASSEDWVRVDCSKCGFNAAILHDAEGMLCSYDVEEWTTSCHNPASASPIRCIFRERFFAARPKSPGERAAPS